VVLGTQRPVSVASTSKLVFGLVQNCVSLCLSPWQCFNLIFASFCKGQHCQVTDILCGVSSLCYMVCIIYCVCETDSHLLRVCTFTLRVVVSMFSLECLVNKYGLGDFCNLVHQFYNERPRTGQSSNRRAWYCIFQVCLLVKCSCVIVLVWLFYLMSELERAGLGTGCLS
jgi:hypothetical protein